MLSDIVFPVFPVNQLSDRKIKEENNILYLGDKILDNKNLPYDTLSERRLRIPKKDLHELLVGFKTIKPMISRTNEYFIDSVGTVFRYIPTQFRKLIYRKITDIIDDPKCYYVFAQGIDVYFKLPLWYNITKHQYVGVIAIGKSLLIYEITDERKKDTRKKV